ncbi:MAG TPA: class I SAM-dependent methyltransferase [Vicinamibacterales bacterium]
MPDERSLFQTTGPSWSERACLGELDAVLTGTGNYRRNLFLHHTQLVAARYAAALVPRTGRVVDFGCGTGRFMRFFAPRVRSVIGTELTKEMAERAVSLGLPPNCTTVLTDGVAIPVAGSSVDLLWVCGVLRYSLNVSNPKYEEIAREMARVLRPGGWVVNFEMYVDQPARDFTNGFEAARFRTELLRILHWHDDKWAQFVQSGRLPAPLIPIAARWMASRRLAMSPTTRTGLRDYLFVWRKPH